MEKQLKSLKKAWSEGVQSTGFHKLDQHLLRHRASYVVERAEMFPTCHFVT